MGVSLPPSTCLAGLWCCATVLRHTCPPAQTRGFLGTCLDNQVNFFANTLKFLSIFAMKPSVFGIQLLTAVVGSYQASGCCAPSLPSIPLCSGRVSSRGFWSAHSLHYLTLDYIPYVNLGDPWLITSSERGRFSYSTKQRRNLLCTR